MVLAGRKWVAHILGVAVGCVRVEQLAAAHSGAWQAGTRTICRQYLVPYIALINYIIHASLFFYLCYVSFVA